MSSSSETFSVVVLATSADGLDESIRASESETVPSRDETALAGGSPDTDVTEGDMGS
jgi:hypothetical protein